MPSLRFSTYPSSFNERDSFIWYIILHQIVILWYIFEIYYINNIQNGHEFVIHGESWKATIFGECASLMIWTIFYERHNNLNVQ